MMVRSVMKIQNVTPTVNAKLHAAVVILDSSEVDASTQMRKWTLSEKIRRKCLTI
jgi:hypothetical protein